MSNICLFQLLKHKKLLLVFVSYDNKRNYLGFELLVGQKKRSEDIHLNILNSLFTFMDPGD